MTQATRVLVGVDTGGTFTDLVALDDGGRLLVAKVPSTPPAFEEGIVATLAAAALTGSDVEFFAHGTTATTNAIITKSGARTALVTTSGFRDVLELRRHNREDLYDIYWDPPEPLVRRRDRLEVEERVAYDGQVVTPLDEAAAREAAALLARRGVEAVAVVFLHSYANATHEEQVREILAEALPETYIVTSSSLLPEEQEFERTATTVANAYLGPILRGYVTRLASALETTGFAGGLFVMHSGGGLMPADSIARVPARTVTSGPAAGVIAAAGIGAAAGRRNLLTIDVGGTSADIATVRDGVVRLTRQFSPEFGLPIRFPAIDLVTMGAGGGSIAWLDPAGSPRVGPRSAGAVPGPAAYGRGGTDATVTDANIVLGRLTPGRALAGGLELAPELARAAVSRFGERLGLGVEEAAAGIIRIANANMARWLRVVTVERGLDPREFTLFAFGGAGPMHAVDLARDLEVPEVLVPLHPGVTSALGLLFSDVVHDYSATLVCREDRLLGGSLDDLLAGLEAHASEDLERDGFAPEARSVARLLDLRFVGQIRALTVPLDARTVDEQWPEVRAAFLLEYEARYQYVPDDLALEVCAARVRANGQIPHPELEQVGAANGPPVPIGARPVWFDGGLVETTIFARDGLRASQHLVGPALVEQLDTTTVLPPGVRAEVDVFGNLLIRTQEAV
ncbi:MAG: hydantoinase/oxoprolinase family protein [Gaiella sp.]